MTHAVKTWPEYFEAQIKEEKLFELRKLDRTYDVGDNFLSQEFDPIKNEYTGRQRIYRITYILKDAPQFGLMDGYCIMQLKREILDN